MPALPGVARDGHGKVWSPTRAKVIREAVGVETGSGACVELGAEADFGGIPIFILMERVCRGKSAEKLGWRP